MIPEARRRELREAYEARDVDRLRSILLATRKAAEELAEASAAAGRSPSFLWKTEGDRLASEAVGELEAAIRAADMLFVLGAPMDQDAGSVWCGLIYLRLGMEDR